MKIINSTELSVLPAIGYRNLDQIIKELEEFKCDNSAMKLLARYIVEKLKKDEMTKKDYCNLKILLRSYDDNLASYSKECLIKGYSSNKQEIDSQIKYIIDNSDIQFKNVNDVNIYAIALKSLYCDMKKLINTVLNEFIEKARDDKQIILRMLYSIEENDEFGIVEVTKGIFKEKYGYLNNRKSHFYYFYLFFLADIQNWCYEIFKRRYINLMKAEDAIAKRKEEPYIAHAKALSLRINKNNYR